MPLKCNCLEDQINLMFADWYLPPPLSQAIPCKFHNLANASMISPNSLTHRLMYILNTLSVHSTPLLVSPSPYSLPQVPSVQTTSNFSWPCLGDIEGVKDMLFQNIPHEQIDYFKLKSPKKLQLQKWSLARIFLHIISHTHSFEGKVFPISLGKDPVPQVIWPARKKNK